MAPPRDPREFVEPMQVVAWAREPSTQPRVVGAMLRGFLGVGSGGDEPGWAALLEAIHPDDVAPFARICADDGPADASLTLRYLRGDERRWATARVTRGGGRVDGVLLDITDRIRADEADRHRAGVLIGVASKISENLEVPAVARALCVQARAAFGDEVRAAFMLYDADERAYVLVHREGAPPGSTEVPARIAVDGIAPIERTTRVRYEPDTSNAAARAASPGVRGFAVAYLIHGDTFLGVLTLATFDRPLVLAPADLELLGAMADQAAAAVHNARVLTESRLHAQRYRNILDTVFDGINITGFDGVIRYCNNQFAAMLGVKPEAVVGKCMRDLLFPEDFEEAVARVKRRRAGYTAPFTWRLRALDDGHQVYVRANSREIKDEHGEPVAMLGVISDVTGTRLLEDRLLQTQKLESLAVLAGGVAHDFNNLLVGILGNAGLAMLELPPGSSVRPLVEGIQAGAQRAADLTRQLLSFSGKGRFVLSALDMNHVIDQMRPILRAADGSGVDVRFDLAAGVPAVEADAGQLRQVVLNLFTNASEAVRGGGVVTVATSVVQADELLLADTFVDDQLAPGEYVCVEITDTGPGMAPETLGRIFDPFYTTKFVGRGLGLAAVLGILRAHKGAIKVVSAPGRGACIRVFLPAMARAASVAPARSVPAGRGARTILVVDDEDAVRAVARRVFERAGYQVIVAADGVEGVERFAERADDIAAVLLDVTMPRMGAEEAFGALRRIRADVRVLLTSGYSEQEAMGRFAGEGLAGFVEKPFLPETLLEKLRAVLGD